MRPYEPFIQIPGPNPILRPGGATEWDGRIIECCDVLKDNLTYVLYYHGVAADTEHWRGGYRIGAAVADHPLGPWRKHPGPLVGLGEPGAWDDLHVACAFVIRRGAGEYLMWYSGTSQEAVQGPPGEERWSVGLATADTPLGPWTKHPANPILPRFGYVGGVVLRDGQFWLYTEYPIGARGPDYGPLSLAIAERPEGPYTPHEANPILRPGEWGEWDDGGFSEAEVSFNGGLFHCFYGGAKLHPVRIESQESIGYAWSEDGVHFHKHLGPVALREHNADATAFAEVHHLIEPPLVYCYHTLRYASRPGDEDLGVQVLATQRPFCVTMPVLTLERLGPGERTDLATCPPLALGHVQSAALTVTCAGEVDGLLVAAYGSADGLHLDTVPLAETEVWAGQQTVPLPAHVPYVKVAMANMDETCEAGRVTVVATLKG
ncbi:hypothetical protein LLH23_12170 [bacterium]|nr:hypothetical protein [bacterium]